MWLFDDDSDAGGARQTNGVKRRRRRKNDAHMSLVSRGSGIERRSDSE